MAQRTVHAFWAAYCCSCCAMATMLMLLSQPVVGMAVVPAAGGGQLGAAAGGGQLGAAAADTAAAGAIVQPAPSSAARDKRWSTTFGAGSNNKNVTAYAVQECSTDSDCLSTPFTSCAFDPSDKKRRCLCADAKQPLNGDCLKKPRALKTSCETDVECLPNAICKNNATLTNPRLKICACKDGFTEEKESCSYADLLTFNYATLLVTVFTSWILNDHRA